MREHVAHQEPPEGVISGEDVPVQSEPVEVEEAQLQRAVTQARLENDTLAAMDRDVVRQMVREMMLDG